MEFIERHALICKNDRVLMSLSAGKDSMFLLHALRSIAEELGFATGIFHLNHMMRGEDADRDEAHVAECARRYGIELFARRHDFLRDAYPGVSFEEHARNVRYRMAAEIAAENGFNKIATGHTRDDSVETVLMRVFAGTGIHGLQGIPPKRGAIVRPLLSVASEEIYGFLKERGIEWREDASNSDPAYARNFIRREIVPLVRRKFPMMDASVRSLSELAGEMLGLLDRLLQEKYGDPVQIDGGTVRVDADIIRDDYPAFCHMLSKAIRGHFAHPVNRSMLEEIFSKYRVGRANIDIYSDSAVRIAKRYREGKSWLEITSAARENAEYPEWEYMIDCETLRETSIYLKEIGISVAVKLVDYPYFRKFVKNNRYTFLALEKNIKTIYIRNRRRGDRIRTKQGTKKIKDIMIEMKLDAATKELIPLLAVSDHVAACMTGLLFDAPSRVSADFLVDKNSKKVLAVFKN